MPVDPKEIPKAKKWNKIKLSAVLFYPVLDLLLLHSVPVSLQSQAENMHRAFWKPVEEEPLALPCGTIGMMHDAFDERTSSTCLLFSSIYESIIACFSVYQYDIGHEHSSSTALEKHETGS